MPHRFRRRIYQKKSPCTAGCEQMVLWGKAKSVSQPYLAHPPSTPPKVDALCLSTLRDSPGAGLGWTTRLALPNPTGLFFLPVAVPALVRSIGVPRRDRQVKTPCASLHLTAQQPVRPIFPALTPAMVDFTDWSWIETGRREEPMKFVEKVVLVSM